MNIYEHQIVFDRERTTFEGFPVFDFHVDLNLGMAEYRPGLLRFDIRRIDARPVKKTDTAPEDLRAVLIHIDADQPTPTPERLNALGSMAIAAYWSDLELSRFGLKRRREAAQAERSALRRPKQARKIGPAAPGV
ncbi:hypothetical protein [Novosphingobium sp. FKTRR1]|uniref:hypothetical protein n=1 Tax=Novosphingobium sp. FKTRR1 TaxID=2879118 RepID=UPI001CF07B98|nr:hypothetical protein [Novosphingobium sp. FKTRR1]